jgi:urease accessory protein
MKHLHRLVAAGLCFLPALAAAHPGHYHPPGEDDEFDALTNGFLHPLTGIDHLILAIAAGWLAFSWKGGKARIPLLAFLGAFAVGAVTGRGFQGSAVLEIALAATLIAAGAAFVFGKNLRFRILATALTAAGFIHGFAHGSEAAANIPFAAYATGFLTGTALLLAIGGALKIATVKAPLAPRLAGCALLIFGSASLIQAL